jgi:hypothetical protein
MLCGFRILELLVRVGAKPRAADCEKNQILAADVRNSLAA